MAKFEMVMELTGLKISVKGDRSDMPQIAQQVGHQVAGLISAAPKYANGSQPLVLDHASSPDESQLSKGRKKGNRRSPGAQNGDTGKDSSAVDWDHDPTTWGYPKQEWNPTKKSIWLLRVVDAVSQIGELTAPVIAKTFNKHFRSSGAILAGNVSRDLGKQKKATPPTIGERTTSQPSTWYLTEAGKKLADTLILEALGKTEKA